MSPVGDTLRTRCRNFPGLVNNASIDWFMPWPKQALCAVASVFLGEQVGSFCPRLVKQLFGVSVGVILFMSKH
jgi:hypothetical protein